MARKEMLLGALFALFTASSAPWWIKYLVRETPNANASEPITPSTPPPRISPELPTTADVSPPPITRTPPGDCTGKRYLQIASGTDRGGMVQVVDQIRALGGPYAQAALYTTSREIYTIVVGCFDLFVADQLKEDFMQRGVLTNEPLVTQGQSLRDRVY
jgi:hypothetical protein